MENDVKIDNFYQWTESSSVLHWLQGAHKKEQLFAANMAAEILENSSIDQWRHVKGIEKHADFGARGISIEGLKQLGSINGPEWLQRDEEE